jgi:hypothetical protein
MFAFGGDVYPWVRTGISVQFEAQSTSAYSSSTFPHSPEPVY